MSAECYLYCIEANCDPCAVKVGVSSDPDKRLRQLQTGSAHHLSIARLWPMESREVALSIEADIHLILAPREMCGEWFAVNPESASGAAILAGIARQGAVDEIDHGRRLRRICTELREAYEARA